MEQCLAGEFQSNHQVLLDKIVLSEFKHTAYIDNQQCQVFTDPCYYFIIFDCDFICKVYFHIDSQNNSTTCIGMSVSMCNPDIFTDSTCLRYYAF